MSEADRERWERRYREGSHVEAAPPDWLDELGDELARSGRALDVAAGTGPVALWLARRGLEVVAVDVSPAALERCRAAARAEGLEVRAVVADLERAPLPPGPFELVSCFHYLQRDLFPAMRECLGPGGVLACEIATKRNLERHAHPSARFLLEPNELLALLGPLEVAYYREGWLGDRCVARALARRPPV